TIVIDPRPVRTTDFSLSRNDVRFLLTEGRASALRWLHYWADDKRPTLEEVDQAEKRSSDLRALVIAERWRQLWPRLCSIFLLFLLSLLTLLYATHASGSRVNTQPDGNRESSVTQQVPDSDVVIAGTIVEEAEGNHSIESATITILDRPERDTSDS